MTRLRLIHPEDSMETPPDLSSAQPLSEHKRLSENEPLADFEDIDLASLESWLLDSELEGDGSLEDDGPARPAIPTGRLASKNRAGRDFDAVHDRTETAATSLSFRLSSPSLVSSRFIWQPLKTRRERRVMTNPNFMSIFISLW